MKEDLSMFGGWAIDIECYKKILEILPRGNTILELGSGLATNKLSEKYKMFSIEHDENWVNKYNSTYIYAPLVYDYNNPIINWYDVKILKEKLPTEYDLILVDGPPGGASINKMTRDGFRRNIDLFNIENTLIIFDDIQRKEEMWSMNMLVSELNRRFEIFTGGTGNNIKKFGIIYPT